MSRRKVRVGGIYEHGCSVISEKRHLVATYKSRIVPRLLRSRKLARLRFTIAEKLIPVLVFGLLLRSCFYVTRSFYFGSFPFFRLSSVIFLSASATLPFSILARIKKGGKGEEKRCASVCQSHDHLFSLIFSANKSF